MGLNAWSLVGLSEYEFGGLSEVLDRRIMPKKKFRRNLENWAREGPAGWRFGWASLDRDLGLGLSPTRERVKWPFTLIMDY